ncbi:MAG: hypothetical protein PQJ60_12925 [Spirochaetales bacterium]|nr:hypothetical protein [Spirochaetales bacterium]
MSKTDILAAALLLAAYASTWFLFLRSLHIVKVLDHEKISRLNMIKKRFGPGKSRKSREVE